MKNTYPLCNSLSFLSLLSLCALFLSIRPVAALDDFPGYSETTHNLYSSWENMGGIVTRNTDPTFVGAGLDWTGIGHWTNDYNTILRAMISPVDLPNARHTSALEGPIYFATEDNTVTSYSGAHKQTNNLFPPDGVIATFTRGHISPDSGITTYAILDLSPPTWTELDGSDYVAPYIGLDVIEVGRDSSSRAKSPRIAETQIVGIDTLTRVMTDGTKGNLQGGDSGGPTMSVWTNPLGESELTYIASHTARTTTLNIGNLFGGFGLDYAKDATIDTGFGLRVVGVAATEWTGAASSDFETVGNWTSGTAPVAGNYVLFTGASTAQRTVDLAGGTSALRGLQFGAGAVGEGFTFQNGTLELGRGGIQNYSDATQTLASGLNVQLTDHQYWEAINADIQVDADVDLNGNLLVVQGNHNTTITGALGDSTGTGVGFTKYGLGTLSLQSAADYAGKTWLYGGTLSLDGAGALPDATNLYVANNATVNLVTNGKSLTVSGLNSIDGAEGVYGTIDLGATGVLTLDKVEENDSKFFGRITGGTVGETAVVLQGSGWTDFGGSSDYAGQTIIDNNIWIMDPGAFGATGVGNETIIKAIDGRILYTRFYAEGTIGETFIMENQPVASGGTARAQLNFASADLTMSGPIILKRQATNTYRASEWNLQSLNSTGTVANVHFGDITGDLADGAPVASTTANKLKVQLYNGSTFHFDGEISDGSFGRLNVDFIGSGTHIVNGVSTYTGRTEIAADKFIVTTDSLNGEAGAFGNGTLAVYVSGPFYATDGVEIGRTLRAYVRGSRDTVFGAEENANVLYSGQVLLDRAEATLYAGSNSVVTFSNTISPHTTGTYSGDTMIRKQGVGTVVLSGDNTYTGGTQIEEGRLRVESNAGLGSAGTVLISAGTLEVAGGVNLANSNVQLAGGHLRVDGSVSGVDFQNGVLSGIGEVGAALALNDAATQILAPGNSVGTLTIDGDQTWTGFTYQVEINDFSSASGADLLSLSGELTLGGTYVLDITSLTLVNEAGDVGNFTEGDQSWVILTAAGGINGFDAGEWTLNTTNFTTGSGMAGGFSIGQLGGDSLVLNYSPVPEPGTATLLILGGIGFASMFRRKQRRK
ncbi:MAG: autotransporter-associated beta strand repeat-containing protein [Chthoniobacterales bacterium]